MNDTATHVMSPIIQFGFAGFSVILLGILIWLIRELLTVIKENNRIIAANTIAIASVVKNSADTMTILVDVKDEILKRPCIAKFRQE